MGKPEPVAGSTGRVRAWAAAPFVAIGEALRPYRRIDREIVVLAAVFSLLFFPLLHRDTEAPQRLAAFSNDEPWQVLALEAMTRKPYGNPANFQRKGAELPAYWGSIRYDLIYYGGFHLDLAYLAFAPLHALGLPTFPTAPIILRAVSALCALLSLVLLYNFSRRHAGRLAAVVAVVVLLTDNNFLFYTAFIKPDSLQFLLGMLALFTAVQHVRDRRTASLVGLGLIAGLIQGTKAGGPWLIPLAVVAAWLGTANPDQPGRAGKRLATLIRRLVYLGIAAIGAYFVTTPYAFLDPYFLTMAKVGWATLFETEFSGVRITGWLMETYMQWGLLLCLLGAAGLFRALARGWGPGGDIALALAALIAVSQLLWYGMVIRLWVSLGFVLIGLGFFAVFAGDSLTRVLRWLRERRGLGRFATVACGILISLVILEGRWYQLPLYVLKLHNTERNTVIEANRWAIANGIPSDSRIVFDDIAYFDPGRFPRAHMHGGVMKWIDVSRYKPDYLVLSLPVLAYMPYSELMKTQHLSREDPYPFSMRLYQDLIFQDSTGPTQVPGIELVAVLDPSIGRALDPAACSLWVGNRGTYVFEGKSLSELVQCHARQHARHAREMGVLLGNAVGTRNDLMGSALRIYRVRSPEAGGK